jgi:hypothetical protein
VAKEDRLGATANRTLRAFTLSRNAVSGGRGKLMTAGSSLCILYLKHRYYQDDQMKKHKINETRSTHCEYEKPAVGYRQDSRGSVQGQRLAAVNTLMKLRGS